MPILSKELKQSKEFTWLVVIVSLLFVLLLYIAPIENFVKNKIKYEITGSADSADITLSNETGSMEKHVKVSLPYIKEIKKDGFTYIAAQSNNDAPITARIYRNDKIILSSTGTYVRVTTNE